MFFEYIFAIFNQDLIITGCTENDIYVGDETMALVAEVRKTPGVCLKMFAISINDIYRAKYKIQSMI